MDVKVIVTHISPISPTSPTLRVFVPAKSNFLFPFYASEEGVKSLNAARCVLCIVIDLELGDGSSTHDVHPEVGGVEKTLNFADKQC